MSGLYSTSRWVHCRALQLQREPCCALCLTRGVVTPASVADHVEPHGGDWLRFFTGRLQSLCKPCHDTVKRVEDKRVEDKRGYSTAVGADGFPSDPRHPFNSGLVPPEPRRQPRSRGRP
jgi:hypothetical protein